MLCKDLGRLLTALPIYVEGVFGSDAIVGDVSSGAGHGDNVLLDITIFIRVNGRASEQLRKDVRDLEMLIYNPEKHNDFVLSRVCIGYDFYE